MEFLHGSPLLLLFLVAALGNLLGHLRVGGFSLGVAAVLFVGLAVNAADPRLVLPPFVQELGLVLFVYTIGLSSGPSFFASFRKRGARDAVFTVSLVAAAALLTAAGKRLLHLSGPTAAGVFCGALTNTPALASVTEWLRERTQSEPALAAPVVGYSIAYPMGVLGVLLALYTMKRAARDAAPMSLRGGSIVNRTVRITQENAAGKPAEALRRAEGWGIVFTRHRRGETTRLVDDMTVLQTGDMLTLVGTAQAVQAATAYLGEPLAEGIELDRSEIDFRRIFVSNPDVVGLPLGALDLNRKFGAHVTRVRRGDVELLADDELVLQPGDRVRVVAPRERLGEISQFFGDSYKALGEVDVVTVGLGIALGLLLGHVRVPLTQDIGFSLGIAGGPLVMGLFLGRLGRTGPLVWSMPYSANLTLRQIGLVLFFAGVGTRSGATFAATVHAGGSVWMLALGALLTLVSAFAAMWIGHRFLRIPLPLLSGMTAGLHTQPAALAFATSQHEGDAPNQGYSAIFPLATIAKIIAAQVLVALMQ